MSDEAQAHQGIGAFMCEFSALEQELGEAVKIVLRLHGNPAADAIVGVISDFGRKTNIVKEAVQTATKVGGTATTLAWKASADKTMNEVLGCNNPDRVDLAHCYLEPQPDGSVNLSRPGKKPKTWSAPDIDTKIGTLRRLTSEVATIRSDLSNLNIPVPTGWMSVDTFQPRQISPRLWDALLSTSTSGTGTPIAASTP
jgi:hypothetical protein